MESLIPKALEYGIPGADTLDIAALPGRVRAEMKAAGYAITAASTVCAWARTPE